MSVHLYDPKVNPHAPDRFFLADGVYKVGGHSGGVYILSEGPAWLRGERIVVLLRGGEIIAEANAGEIRPEVNDILLVPHGEILRLRASMPLGSFATTDDNVYNTDKFPENGVLIRGRNGSEVYLGQKAYAEYCAKLISAARATA